MKRTSVSGRAAVGYAEDSTGYVANVTRKRRHRELIKEVAAKRRQLEAAQAKAGDADSHSARERDRSRVRLLEEQIENLSREAAELEALTLRDAWGSGGKRQINSGGQGGISGRENAYLPSDPPENRDEAAKEVEMLDAELDRLMGGQDGG